MAVLQCLIFVRVLFFFEWWYFILNQLFNCFFDTFLLSPKFIKTFLSQIVLYFELILLYSFENNNLTTVNIKIYPKNKTTTTMLGFIGNLVSSQKTNSTSDEELFVKNYDIMKE